MAVTDTDSASTRNDRAARPLADVGADAVCEQAQKWAAADYQDVPDLLAGASERPQPVVETGEVLVVTAFPLPEATTAPSGSAARPAASSAPTSHTCPS